VLYSVLLADFWLDVVPATLNVLIILACAFLILLVLIQRGKGGGLAGAFGGAGGSSAFGSRAGDQFTFITLVTAGITVLLIMLMIKMVPQSGTKAAPPPDTPAPAAPGPEGSTQLTPPATGRIDIGAA
jgi:preprotein translocase subunit SecG